MRKSIINQSIVFYKDFIDQNKNNQVIILNKWFLKVISFSTFKNKKLTLTIKFPYIFFDGNTPRNFKFDYSCKENSLFNETFNSKITWIQKIICDQGKNEIIKLKCKQVAKLLSNYLKFFSNKTIIQKQVYHPTIVLSDISNKTLKLYEMESSNIFYCISIKEKSPTSLFISFSFDFHLKYYKNYNLEFEYDIFNNNIFNLASKFKTKLYNFYNVSLDTYNILSFLHNIQDLNDNHRIICQNSRKTVIIDGNDLIQFFKNELSFDTIPKLSPKTRIFILHSFFTTKVTIQIFELILKFECYNPPKNYDVVNVVMKPPIVSSFKSLSVYGHHIKINIDTLIDFGKLIISPEKNFNYLLKNDVKKLLNIIIKTIKNTNDGLFNFICKLDNESLNKFPPTLLYFFSLKFQNTKFLKLKKVKFLHTAFSRAIKSNKKVLLMINENIIDILNTKKYKIENILDFFRVITSVKIFPFLIYNIYFLYGDKYILLKDFMLNIYKDKLSLIYNNWDKFKVGLTNQDLDYFNIHIKFFTSPLDYGINVNKLNKK